MRSIAELLLNQPIVRMRTRLHSDRPEPEVQATKDRKRMRNGCGLFDGRQQFDLFGREVSLLDRARSRRQAMHLCHDFAEGRHDLSWSVDMRHPARHTQRQHLFVFCS